MGFNIDYQKILFVLKDLIKAAEEIFILSMFVFKIWIIIIYLPKIFWKLYINICNSFLRKMKHLFSAYSTRMDCNLANEYIEKHRC